MFTFASKQCVDPSKLFDQCVTRELPTDLFAGKANRFRVNAGSVPSAGSLLMDGGDFAALDTSRAYTLTIRDHLNNILDFDGLYIVGAVRVVAGAVGDPNAVYLLDVADNRTRLRRVPINKAYNVRTAAGSGYQTATLNAGVAWTWATMGADLWAAVGGLGTWPGLPFTPHGTPENFDFYGKYALDSLVKFLNRVGCELQHDNTTDTYSVVQIGNVPAGYFNGWAAADAKFSGQNVSPDSTNRPEKIRVRFRVMPVPTDASTPYYNVDVSLAVATGVLAGSVVILEDDLAALGSGTPSNAAALATRAAERASDWLRRWTGRDKPAVIQYRQYYAPARLAVGFARTAVVYEDAGDGYTTEVFALPDGGGEYGLPLLVPDGGGALATQNVDGTEAGTTSDMRFDQATGVKIRQDTPGDVVSLIDASPTQTGVINTTTQTVAGAKTVWGIVTVTSSGATPNVQIAGNSTTASVVVTGPTASNHHFISETANTITTNLGNSALATIIMEDSGGGSTPGVYGSGSWAILGSKHCATTSSGASYLWLRSNNPSANITGLIVANEADGRSGIKFNADYNSIAIEPDNLTFTPDPSGPGSSALDLYALSGNVDGTGYPIRHGRDLIADSGYTHGGRRSGVDKKGIDVTFAVAVGDVLEFVAGHLITHTSSGSSPPPPSPPVSSSPPPSSSSPPPSSPPPPTTGSLRVRTVNGGGSPLSGRLVNIDGGAPFATDAAGYYTWFLVSAGLHSVAVNLIGGETASWTGTWPGGSGSGSGNIASPITVVGGAQSEVVITII